MEHKYAIYIASASDKACWDEYVERHQYATPYHSFSWMEAVKSAYGHPHIGAIARCLSSQKVVGVFPAVLMKTPFKGKQICALPYCDVGYPLADNHEILNALRKFEVKQLDLNNTKSIEIRNVSYQLHNDEELLHKKVRMLLTLPNSSKTLMDSFKSKLRSQIKKAQKNGLQCKQGRHTQLVEDFYDVYARNMRDLGSPAHARKWFHAIVQSYGDNAVVSVVYNGDDAIGGGIILTSGHQACIPWASTLREHNVLAPNMLLYWSLLAHCADNNITQFDFGRSTYLQGTYKFKKQWGAEPQLLEWQKFNGKGERIDEAAFTEESPSIVREVAERLWRRLPLKITIITGSLIRPHISL